MERSRYFGASSDMYHYDHFIGGAMCIPGCFSVQLGSSPRFDITPLLYVSVSYFRCKDQSPTVISVRCPYFEAPMERPL
jgi:hypothetical protein